MKFSLLVGLAWGIAAAIPAYAQSSPGQRLAQAMFADTFGPAIEQQLSGAAAPKLGSELGFPDWDPLLVDAMREELRHDRPAIISMVGESMAKQFTADELTAGAVLFESATGRRFLSEAVVSGKSNKPTREDEAFLRSWGRTPGAESFMKKFSALDPKSIIPEKPLLREVVPGAMRRFGEKAEAQVRRTQP